MIRVAIVDDSETDAKQLISHLKAYSEKDGGEAVSYTVYSDAVKFLDQGSSTADIVFMDIEMPFMNGMDAAASSWGASCSPASTAPAARSATSR